MNKIFGTAILCAERLLDTASFGIVDVARCVAFGNRTTRADGTPASNALAWAIVSATTLSRKARRSAGTSVATHPLVSASYVTYEGHHRKKGKEYAAQPHKQPYFRSSRWFH